MLQPCTCFHRTHGQHPNYGKRGKGTQRYRIKVPVTIPFLIMSVQRISTALWLTFLVELNSGKKTIWFPSSCSEQWFIWYIFYSSNTAFRQLEFNGNILLQIPPIWVIQSLLPGPSPQICGPERDFTTFIQWTKSYLSLFFRVYFLSFFPPIRQSVSTGLIIMIICM